MKDVKQKILNYCDFLWISQDIRLTSTWVVRLTYLFAICKILLSWPVSLNIVDISEFSQAKLYSFPLRWITERIELFLIVFIALMAFSIYRSSYLIKVIILLFGILYFRIHISIINGADAVVLALFSLAILLDPPKHYKPGSWPVFLSNSALLLARIHITTLYFVSGADKLLSAAWRSGKAIDYLSQIDYLFNPHLISIYPTHPIIHFVVAWVVILFELFFSWFGLNDFENLFFGPV
ncbi:MAG: hypothetical protein HC811_04445 [Flammeovirgaceae bacterium]|nr:hypothetical protein [Flammeovirgaceae bacterium]